MILEQEKFDRLSNGSGQRVLVRCDGCGFERAVIKQNLVRARNHDCQKCAAAKVGKAIGPLSKGGGVIGRKYSEDAKRRLRSSARRGPKNNRWNPDRGAVLRNERARKSIYTLLYGTLRRLGRGKEARTVEVLGYTAADLAAHLESKFLPGMSWANRSEWHIDHIKPVSAFIREGVDDPAVISALSNLQPLWAAENMSKRDSYGDALCR